MSVVGGGGEECEIGCAGVVVLGRVERFCMRVKRREKGKMKMILGVIWVEGILMVIGLFDLLKRD
ncbi:hypothetical protein, partial [Bacillus pumilus]|uniref:hypothetical protein n=1 Tax=Bacillus pumilus TaxID=1408 RepID=UPI0011A728C0